MLSSFTSVVIAFNLPASPLRLPTIRWMRSEQAWTSSARFRFRGVVVLVLIVNAAATDALPSGYRPAVLEFRILGSLEVIGPQGTVHLGET